jgi:hypothetical protein
MSETNSNVLPMESPVVEATPAPAAPPAKKKASSSSGKSGAKVKKGDKAKKAAKKSAAPKKGAKKAAEGEKTPAERFMADIPAPERKKKLVEMMRSKGATKASAALTVVEMSEEMGWTKFDVYGLMRGTSGKADSNPNSLVAKGFIKVVDVEGKGLSFHLTPSGVKTKFNEAPFVRVSKAVAAEPEKKGAKKKSAKGAVSTAAAAEASESSAS